MCKIQGQFELIKDDASYTEMRDIIANGQDASGLSDEEWGQHYNASVKYKLMAMGNVKFIAHLLVSDCHDAEKAIAEYGIEAELNHKVETPFVSQQMMFRFLEDLFYVDIIDNETGHNSLPL